MNLHISTDYFFFNKEFKALVADLSDLYPLVKDNERHILSSVLEDGFTVYNPKTRGELQFKLDRCHMTPFNGRERQEILSWNFKAKTDRVDLKDLCVIVYND